VTCLYSQRTGPLTIEVELLTSSHQNLPETSGRSRHQAESRRVSRVVSRIRLIRMVNAQKFTVALVLAYQPRRLVVELRGERMAYSNRRHPSIPDQGESKAIALQKMDVWQSPTARNFSGISGVRDFRCPGFP
jgi:hypothetical protein